MSAQVLTMEMPATMTRVAARASEHVAQRRAPQCWQHSRRHRCSLQVNRPLQCPGKQFPTLAPDNLRSFKDSFMHEHVQ
jgi:hypothetical protein